MWKGGAREEEEEEEEGLFKADAVNEEDPERDRAAISVRFCTLGDSADLVLVMPPRHCSKLGGGHPCRSNWADHTSMGDHARRGAGGNWSDAQCSFFLCHPVRQASGRTQAHSARVTE